MAGDICDIWAMHRKILELWNVREDDEKKKIAMVFYQLCASFMAGMTAHREEWGVAGAKRSCIVRILNPLFVSV